MTFNELKQTLSTNELRYSDFDKIRNLVYDLSGISLSDNKLVMVYGRLAKRLRALKLKTYNEYVDYLFSKKGQTNEIQHLLNCVTTNKTDFFREENHFRYIETNAINEVLQKTNNVNIWSAACSTGEEVYSLAITFRELQDKYNFDFSVIGSDIDTNVLERASKAIYPAEKSADIDFEIKKRYFLRSKDRKNVKIIPEIRHKVNFKYINLTNTEPVFNNRFDIIFLRNVLIYFDIETQKQVINNILRYLKQDGFLFLGHSESLLMRDIDLVPVSSSVYKYCKNNKL
jgi:chemotaxis protein methyltransferase CheR